MRVKARLPLTQGSITEALTHELIMDRDAGREHVAGLDRYTNFAYVHRGLAGDRRSRTRLGSEFKKEEIKEKIKDRIKGEIENLIRRNFNMRKIDTTRQSSVRVRPQENVSVTGASFLRGSNLHRTQQLTPNPETPPPARRQPTKRTTRSSLQRHYSTRPARIPTPALHRDQEIIIKPSTPQYPRSMSTGSGLRFKSVISKHTSLSKIGASKARREQELLPWVIPTMGDDQQNFC